MAETDRRKGRDLDRDPETGPQGDHVGGMAGGAFAGKALAERINPAHEADHWRHEFPARRYAVASRYGFMDYEPAYLLGYERYPEFAGRRFDDATTSLSRSPRGVAQRERA
jgi:hypothetical protein